MRPAAASMSSLTRSSSESSTSCVTLPSSRLLHGKHRCHVMLISHMLFLPTCIRDGYCGLNLSMAGQIRRQYVCAGAPALHWSALDCCTLFHKDDLYEYPSGYLPAVTVLCWSTTAPRHARADAPCLLVLHAPMSCTLIVQDNMFGATPVGLPAACWRIQSGFPSCAYQERDTLA